MKASNTPSPAACPSRPMPTSCGGKTSEPDLDEAREFAKQVHAQFPGKLLAYNCSPSFNWRAKLDEKTIAKFQEELGALGYKFQFVTLAGFHSLNHSAFTLAKGYSQRAWRPIPTAAGRVRFGKAGLHRHAPPA